MENLQGSSKEMVRDVLHTFLRKRSWPEAFGVAVLATLAGTVGFGIAFLSRSARKRLKRDGEEPLLRTNADRRWLERERTEFTRQLATIIESSDEAILSKDTDLRITSWNQAAERMFGYKASEAIGQSVLFIIPENRSSEDKLMMHRIQLSRKAERYESERRRKDGTVFPVSLTISPILDATDAVVGVSTIMRDISESKRIEDERQVFLSFFENSPDFIGITNQNWKPVYLNPAGRKMVGLPLDHPVKDTESFEYFPRDQRAFLPDVIIP